MRRAAGRARGSGARRSVTSSADGPSSVLLVEPYGPSRSVLTLLLAEAGFRVHAAASADEALELASRVEMDFLVANASVDEDGGEELIGTIAKHRSGIRSAVVCAPGPTALREGVLHLPVPLDVDALIGFLRRS